MASDATKATQEFVPIQEIKNGIAVLKDGSLRALVLVSSINFALKSDDERAAVLAQFQNFLNSLDFTVQIFIQSRRFDVRPYLALLAQREKEQVNDLMRVQVAEYIEFVRTFTEEHSIMEKRFFVVVPYSPATLQGANKRKFSLPFFSSKTDTPALTKEIFEENLSQLEQRVSVVSQGLAACGLRVAQLESDALVELFYKIFNPGDAEKPMRIN